MIKPMYGQAVRRVAWLFVMHFLLLSLWLDDTIPQLYVYGIRIYGLFIPLYVALARIWKAYAFLPFVWDATWN